MLSVNIANFFLFLYLWHDLFRGGAFGNGPTASKLNPLFPDTEGSLQLNWVSSLMLWLLRIANLILGSNVLDPM